MEGEGRDGDGDGFDRAFQAVLNGLEYCIVIRYSK